MAGLASWAGWGVAEGRVRSLSVGPMITEVCWPAKRIHLLCLPLSSKADGLPKLLIYRLMHLKSTSTRHEAARSISSSVPFGAGCPACEDRTGWKSLNSGGSSSSSANAFRPNEHDA
jgi:hypothetical protein